MDDVLRHRLESGKVPGRVFCLVGTAAGGIYARRYLRCTRKHMPLYATILVSLRYLASRAGQEQHSRHARCRQGAGETFPPHIAIKNSQINHEQSWIVCKEWIRPVLAAATRPMRCSSR